MKKPLSREKLYQIRCPSGARPLLSGGGRASFSIPAGSSPNTYSCLPVRCHNIMHPIIGVPIRFSASSSGHVICRVTHELDIPPDMGFGSSGHSRYTAGSCVLLLQWPFDILRGQSLIRNTIEMYICFANLSQIVIQSNIFAKDSNDLHRIQTIKL